MLSQCYLYVNGIFCYICSSNANHMKVRTVVTFSIISLLFIVLIQVGGMIYAYRNQMKEVEKTLNDCFQLSFMETVDNVVNRMDYPDGTVIGFIYAPESMRLSENEFFFHGSEQLVEQLRTVYKVDGFSLVAMDSVLQNKLDYSHIKGELVIQKFNTHTGEVLESAQPNFGTYLGTVTSQKALINKEKGEAVRAILVSPQGEAIWDVLLLFGITFVLLLIAVYALVVQMKSVIRQRNSIREQQQNFSMLAEQMRVPVTGMLVEISGQTWHSIEKESNILLGMTEAVLNKAKADACKDKLWQILTPKVISIISITGVFLLLVVWSGYLYHIAYKKVEQKTQQCFEDAFYEETVSHRYFSYICANHLKPSQVLFRKSLTPYATRQVKQLRATGLNLRLNDVLVVHTYNELNENFQLRAAYILQNEINKSRIPIALSLQYVDTVFAKRLQATDIPCLSNVFWMKYPSKERILYTGHPEIGKLDLTTKLIPLNEDSTSCIQGVIRAPQKFLLASIWYMLLPLGITFVFMWVCVYLQVRMLRAQRQLKQFQKDFSYSMIHDMKSPLNSIVMGAHILNGGKLADKPDKALRYKQVMTEECGHLLALSERVLILAQIERGELQLEREKVLLEPLLKDLTEKFRLKATKEVEFELSCNGLSVYADPFCLREVLSNLIDNALKYSGEKVKVTIRCEREGDRITIRVKDNGIGIPLRDRQKIFDKFERVKSNTLRTGASGFGLGLNYVKRIIEAHGGTIRVESVEGKYSEFILVTQ